MKKKRQKEQDRLEKQLKFEAEQLQKKRIREEYDKKITRYTNEYFKEKEAAKQDRQRFKFDTPYPDGDPL